MTNTYFYLFIGYTTIWILICLLLWFMIVKLNKLEKKIEENKQKI